MAQARIVIAEDDTIVAEIIRDKLVSRGYDVAAVVASGEDVIKEASEKKPALVLIDIGLTGEVDGVQAAEQIRTRFDIPVVYLTAHTDEATLERAKASGPFGYVLKPIRTEELHTTIQTALYKDEMERKLKGSEPWYRALFDQAQDALILESEREEILDANQAASRLFGYSREEFLTMKTTDLEPQEILSPPRRAVYSAQSLGRGEHVETEIVDRDGKRMPVEITVTPLRIGEQTLFLSSIRDITGRKEAETALHRYTERLRIQREIDQSILAARLPETIAMAAIRRIRRLIPCQRAVVLAAGESGQGELLAAESSSEMGEAEIDIYQELLEGKVLSQGWVQGVEDLDDVAERSPLQQAFYAVGIRAYAVVPLHIEGELVGILSLESHHPRAFTSDHIDIATEVASSLAVAIRQAKLSEKAQDAAAAEERGRLARELHDAVTQTLFSATLIAEALPQMWERQPEEGRRGLEEVRQLTRGALAELRTLLVELRPAALTEKPIGDLLRQLTEAVSARTRVPIALDVRGNTALPSTVQIALYRITQEALNNVAKHAGAAKVSVALKTESGRAALRVQDDGLGFDPGDVLPDRMGLSIMRERAERIGATCQILSQPGHGTQIVVNWQASDGR